MTPPSTVVLDNEPVQALLAFAHSKHRRVLAFLDEVNRRQSQGSPIEVVVPVAVRVEAGWDRSRPDAVTANRISGAHDVPLDRRRTDEATRLRFEFDVSVVDATVGQVVAGGRPPVAVLTSDVEDMERISGGMSHEVRVIRV